MNTSSKSYKIGFSDYQECRLKDVNGIENAEEYDAGYRDAMEQDEMQFNGANDHA